MRDRINLIAGGFIFIAVVFGNSAWAEQKTSATGPGVLQSTSLPGVVPPPVEAVYADELIPIGEEIVCPDTLQGPVRAALLEIVESWKIPLSGTAHKKRFTEITIKMDKVQTRSAGSSPVLPAQGYLLKVIGKPHGVSVSIQSGDEAGAYYALQSLKRLVGRIGEEPAVRPAVIRDWPTFQRRGLILGYGLTTEDLKKRLRWMAECKMNFLLHCGIRPEAGNFEIIKEHIRVIKEFCDAHYIEFCYLGGGVGRLTSRPIRDVLREYEERFHAGLRSYSVNFDDLGLAKNLDEVKSMAEQHASITNQIYRRLKPLDANVRFIFCPVPYGGVAGRVLIAGTLEAGMLYLKVTGEQLAPEIPFFWTGDGGVWSDTITVAGAEAFGRASGRKPFLWDNDTIRFMNQLIPLSGREAALPEALAGYVGNVNELETRWSGISGGVIETIASYTWNPGAYNSRDARQYIQAGREAIRERLKALGIREVLVSGNWQTWENAFDRDPQTAWNSGGHAPGWIELIFDGPRRLRTLFATVTQNPAGDTEHEIVATFKDGSSRTVYNLQGRTETGQVLEVSIRPKLTGLTKLRIVTKQSPSWVAWAEINVESNRE